MENKNYIMTRIKVCILCFNILHQKILMKSYETDFLFYRKGFFTFLFRSFSLPGIA